MKHPPTRGENSRFNGQLRYYHRSGPPSQRTWGEWVDGKKEPSRSPVKWFKIALVVLSLLALGGIVAGLIVELG